MDKRSVLEKRFGRKASRSVLVACAAIGLLVAASSAQATQQRASRQQADLIVAADPALLPYQFYKTGTRQWQGINIDIAKALSAKLGQKLVFKDVSFDNIIPGLQSHRYDLALTGMFDTKDREKTLDFIDYLKANNNFLLLSGNSKTVRSFADLCGVSVGLNKGSFEVQLATQQTAQCKKDGKPPIQAHVYPNLNAATLALVSKRVEVVPNDSATNAYLIHAKSAQFKATGSYEAVGYFALAVLKGSPNLQPLYKAFKKITADGELHTILARWGIADRAVAKPLINHAAF